MYIVLFLVMPFLLVSWAWLRPLETALENRIAGSMESSLSLTGVRVDNLLEKMLSCTASLTMNKALINLFKSPGAQSPYETDTTIRGIISAASSSYFMDIENEITLMDLRGGLYTNWVYGPKDSDMLRDTDWYRACLSSRGTFQWHYGQIKHQYQPAVHMISVARPIDGFQYNAHYGVVSVGVPMRELRLILSAAAYDPEGQLILVDANSTVISHIDASRVGETLAEEPYHAALSRGSGHTVQSIGGVKSLVVFHTLKYGGWRLIQIEPYSTFFEEIEYIRTVNLFAQIAVLVFFTVVSAFIAARVTRPLRALRNEMINLNEKDVQAETAPPIQEDREGRDEIADLEHTYHKMLLRIQRLMQNVRDEQALQSDIRFQFLQAQINAHFILNTISNIKFMAYVGGANAVGEMLASLGGLLEQSLGRDDPVIPLEQELLYLDNYARLRKIGMEDSLEIVIDVPDELRQCAVLTYILQPIIENCLRHGLDTRQSDCRICIGVAHEADDVVIRIQDNGRGIKPAELAFLRERLYAAPPSRTKGSIGLKNVHDRLCITYGEGYGLTIESEQGTGTTVVVRIPFIPFRHTEDVLPEPHGKEGWAI